MLLAIAAFLFGLFAVGIGWLGYGGFIFGIPAIILGILVTKKGTKRVKLWSVLGIILGGLGVAESLIVYTLPVMPEATTSQEEFSTPYSFNITKIDIKLDRYVPKMIVEIQTNFNGSVYLYEIKDSVENWIEIVPFSENDKNLLFYLTPKRVCKGNYTYRLVAKLPNGKNVSEKKITLELNAKLNNFDLQYTCEEYKGKNVCCIEDVIVDVDSEDGICLDVGEIEINNEGTLTYLGKCIKGAHKIEGTRIGFCVLAGKYHVKMKIYDTCGNVVGELEKNITLS